MCVKQVNINLAVDSRESVMVLSGEVKACRAFCDDVLSVDSDQGQKKADRDWGVM